MTTDDINSILDHLNGNWFVLVDKLPDDQASKAAENFLDIFKDQPEANEVLSVFNASRDNLSDLITEAKLLFEHGHHPRSFFTSVLALEELGKSQLAADYYSGIISKDEYDKAFRSHPTKTSYAERKMLFDNGGKTRLYYDVELGRMIEGARQSSLYVSASSTPKAVITQSHAKKILEIVEKRFDEILHAEWLNGRIGSKAIFK